MGYYDEQKRVRYEKIKKTIKENQPIEEQTLISKIKIDEGLSENTVKDYIRDLENANSIEKSEDGYKPTKED